MTRPTLYTGRGVNRRALRVEVGVEDVSYQGSVHPGRTHGWALNLCIGPWYWWAEVYW